MRGSRKVTGSVGLRYLEMVCVLARELVCGSFVVARLAAGMLGRLRRSGGYLRSVWRTYRLESARGTNRVFTGAQTLDYTCQTRAAVVRKEVVNGPMSNW